MTSKEAIECMIAVLVKAEAAADQASQVGNPTVAGELYVKIADQWNDVVWQSVDIEKSLAKADG